MRCPKHRWRFDLATGACTEAPHFSARPLPVREEDEFDYISLKLTVTGDLADLDTALAALSGYTPLLLVESLDIWPNRGAALKEQPAQTISATLQLFSLRAVQ